MKYAHIEFELQQQRAASGSKRALSTLCRMLEVSRSGYYDWLGRTAQPNPDTIALETAARAAHMRGRQSYGALRLKDELAQMGFRLSLGTGH